MGTADVGATIYFGHARRAKGKLVDTAPAFEEAHQFGMFTVLWCLLLGQLGFKKDGTDYHVAADLTGQAH